MKVEFVKVKEDLKMLRNIKMFSNFDFRYMQSSLFADFLSEDLIIRAGNNNLLIGESITVPSTSRQTGF